MAPRKPLPGKALCDLFEELAQQWHPTLNGALSPHDVRPGSQVKVWWLGSCGHQWRAKVLARTNGKTNCPVCDGKVVLAGFNDLATKYPSVAREWHPTRNVGLTPQGVTGTSKRKVWWRGSSCRHEWDAVIANRTRFGADCPICAGQRILIGFNDLATTQRALAAEWHPTKNGSLRVTDVMAGTDKKVWWRGSCRHEWDARIKDRARKGAGCPVCTGRRILIGQNDLSATNPLVAREWHPARNEALTPRSVTAGSEKRVWWVCAEGHEWQAAVKTRTGIGSGCPDCSKARGIRTSLAEEGLRRELGYLYSGTSASAVDVPRTYLKWKWECDIVIEVPGGVKAVVEFDGHATHGEAERAMRDGEKSADLRKQGFIVVRVRPGMDVTHEHDVRITRVQAHHSNAAWMAERVAERLTELGLSPDRLPISKVVLDAAEPSGL